MPSMKRAQESDDSDDSDGSMASKRQRTSSASGSGSSPAPDFLAGEEEELSENQLDEQQTQLIQEKYSNFVDEENVPAEHGILERVECYNFMCHDHFNVELGPLINFIVGKNGSGKSAILTAIVLCLGGKAAATNRGQSLKSFVKEGKDNATIIVRIKNQGDGAYMADDYGKSIIVERLFNTTGNSQFKIKADNGRIVSTKKAELDAITDYFSLQIDNPMNVLSQDMARQFLSTSSPAEKYKFFVKGVQLEQLDQDYRLIEESVDSVEEKLRVSESDLVVLENRKNLAKKKLDRSDQHDSLRAKVRVIRSQMAWAQVEEQEKMVMDLTGEIALADRKIAQAESELAEFDNAFNNLQTEGTAADEHAWRAAAAFEEAERTRSEIQERLSEEMRTRTELQVQSRQIKLHLDGAKSRRQGTLHDIEKERKRLAEISDGGFARKQEEFEQARHDASAARTAHEEHRNNAAAIRSKIEIAERELAEARHPVQIKEGEIAQAENLLRELSKDGGGRQTGMPHSMGALIKAIQQERRFQSAPVGPIANYVTLLKPKWSSILERMFGASLTGFIVTTKQDSNILLDIMRRLRVSFPIFIGSGGHLDTTGNEPDPEFDTALRTLQIDNELVRRQLIINHGIEQMLLIEDRELASATLFDGPRPKNVKRCYCIDSKDRSRGFHLSYSRAGEPSQSPVQAWKEGPRMKSDSALQINAQRDIVTDLKRQLHDLNRELAAAGSHVKSCRQELDRHTRTEKDLNYRVQRAEDHAEALKDALEKENADDSQLDVLQNVLREHESEIELHEGSCRDADAEMAAKMQAIKEVRREINAHQAEQDILKTNLDVAESEKKLVESKRRKLLDDKNAAIRQIELDKAERLNVCNKREQVQRRVQEYTEKAGLVSARVPIDEGETPRSLERKLERLDRDLNRYNTELGASRAEIAAEASRTEHEHRVAMEQFGNLISLAQTLKSTLGNRKKRWEIFRSHISSRAKAQFTYLLSERSFRGRLLTDHVNKLLDLQVEPDITKDDSTGRGAKTLSGGEKSFSQVCLLLSLWEAMGSPIRCLDEFDVYMDHINRKMSIDMLMTAARRSIGRQFILITPGSKTDITISPDVVVKELAAPERGQTRLNFRG